MTDVKLSEFHQDAITEIVNIGVGRAASVLSDMVSTKVGLQVPKVVFIRINEIQDYIENWYIEHSAVRIRFSGGYQGSASIVFGRISAANLAQALGGDDFDNEIDDLDELMKETLNEVGNIVLNSIMGSVANILDGKINYQLPQYFSDKIGNVIEKERFSVDSFVLVANTQFLIEGEEIEGKVILLFSSDSLVEMINNIGKNEE